MSATAHNSKCSAMSVPEPQKDIGTLGKTIKLITNHYRIIINKSQEISLYLYDVEVKKVWEKEEIEPKRYREQKFGAFNKMLIDYPRFFKNVTIGYDREKLAVCVGQIPNSNTTARGHLKVKYDSNEGKTTEYLIGIKFSKKFHLSELIEALSSPDCNFEDFPHTILQMVELLLRHGRTKRYLQLGLRSHFSLGGEFGPLKDIGYGVQIAPGFFSALKPTKDRYGRSQLLMNIDVSHAVVYKHQSVIDFLKEKDVFGDEDLKGPLSNSKKRLAKKALTNLKIQTNHNRFIYKFNNISDYGPEKQTFPRKNKKTKEVTTWLVKDYFESEFNRILKYPSLNCLQLGNDDRNIYIPMENCEIAKGQKVNKSLLDKQMEKFIAHTARSPKDRLEKIKNIKENLQSIDGPKLNALNWQLENEPMKLDGRVLDAPMIQMSNNVKLKPIKGAWNNQGKKFVKAASLKKWCILIYDGRTNETVFENFIEGLMDMAHSKGMDVENPYIKKWISGEQHNPEKDFMELLADYPDSELFLCIIYKKLYGRIKLSDDIKSCVLTQCVQSNTLRKCNLKILSNIVDKINIKLGGINIIVPDLWEKYKSTLIMGADISHPGPRDDKSVSFAAITATSTTNSPFHYAREVCHQRGKEDVMQKTFEMTRNLLAPYKEKNALPEQIVMFRDGVCDSQFNNILEKEFLAIKSACNTLEKNYDPPITFICVQKRHHTRFFVEHSKDGSGRNNNVPPGTVVDTDVTDLTTDNFYLCAHQSPQGTSRPTHYTVLTNQCNFTMDELQQLTYNLCHTYAICPNSVSIPTPTYYAHHVAKRALEHVKAKYSNGTSLTSINELPDSKIEETIKITEFKKSLYEI